MYLIPHPQSMTLKVVRISLEIQSYSAHKMVLRVEYAGEGAFKEMTSSLVLIMQ